MRNYITLNGKNSNEINGLLIQELPPISKPQIRTEVEEIDGRDGDIVTKLGFAAYDKEFTVGLYKDFDINAIIAYFNSEGTVVFSNEPDKYYNYQIIDQIDFERLVRYRTATVRMHCQPFKYSNTEGARTLGNKGTASGEGSFITLDNTPEAQFSKIDPKGNATQMTYSGKNLIGAGSEHYPTAAWYNLNEGETITTTTSGATVADTANGFNITLTAAWYGVFFIVPVTAGQTYHIKINASGTGCRSSLYWLDADKKILRKGGVLNINPLSLEANLTVNSGEAYVALALGSNAATTLTVTEPQLEKGSQASSYEPYVGGTASPNPSYPQPISVVTGENTVKIQGKNLFDKDSAVAGLLNRENGQLWTSSTYMTSDYIKVEAGQTYTSTGFNNWYRAGFNAQKQWTSLLPESDTFTIPNGVSYIRTSVSNANLDTAQLELGATATDYEAYHGQSFEINLGKNLLDPTATLQGVWNNASNTTTCTFFTPIYNGETYTISNQDTATWRFSAGLTTNPTNNPAGTGSQISAWQTGASYAITAQSNGYLWVQLRKNANTAITPSDIPSDVFMVERGSTATSFAPYFTPIELAKIGTYQDRIYKADSKWYIRRAVRHLSLPVASMNDSDSYPGWSNVEHIRADLGTSLNTPLQSVTSRMVNIEDGTKYFGINTNGSGATLFTSNSASGIFGTKTATAIKADYPNLVVELYYGILEANQYDEEITNEALIAQLEALYNQAHAYKGRTHVAAIAQGSNAPHIIEAEVQRSSDGNITNNGNIVSKPTLTIYGSGNIGVSLNGYQILETTLGDEEYITIDTAAMEAYKDTLDNLKNRLVNGDYSKFALRPGSNMIEFSGTVSKCVISKYSRWL